MTRKAVQGGRSAERSTPIQPFLSKPLVWRLMCSALCLIALNILGAAGARAATDSSSRAQIKPDRTHAPAGLPLSFEPNRGQADANVQFLSRGDGYKLFLTSGEADLVLSGQHASSLTDEVLGMKLLGASTAAPATGIDPQSGTINYFVGNDPRKWHTGIPTFGKVNYAGIYPGIDLLFYGNQRQLEYDFVVKPGANPANIAWFFRGAQPDLGQNGSLELNPPGNASGEPLQFLAPVAYQIIDGQRRPVSASYALSGQTVRFALGDYDHSQTLIIDPTLTYFSYLGGTGNDYIGNSFPQGYGSPSPEPTQAAGIDAQGNLYVGGSTFSTDFPVAGALFSRATKGSGQSWAFLSKFSPDGSHLLYSTYIGGSTGGNDAIFALSVDSAGNVYATGNAGTNDFPTTSGAFQTLCAPHRDNNTGNAVATCTFNTGNGNYSRNAFVLKLNPTGSTLVYSTFLGGYGAAWGTGIAIDGAGQAYVTGAAGATLCGGDVHQFGAQYECFPTTSNALISDIGGGNSIDMAFMTVVNATGSGLVYSTLFGDPQGAVSVNGAGCTTDCGAVTYGAAIALDPTGNVYIGGRTISANMHTTTGAFNTTGSGPNPLAPSQVTAPNGYGFVAKFAPVTASGTSLLYSTYFGGGATQGGLVGGLAADSSGNAYITGATYAADFPATPGAYQTTCDPTQRATFCNQGMYVAKLNPAGTALVWATYLGYGSAAPISFIGPVVIDSSQNVYVLGEGSGQLPLGGGKVSKLVGNNTVYVAQLNSTGSQVLLGATVGGPGNGPEKAGGFAVDFASGSIYLAGSIEPGGSFATPGAFQQASAGGTDAFVAKVTQQLTSTTTLTLSAASSTIGQSITLTAKVAGPTGSAVPTGTVTFLSGTTTVGTGTLDSTGTATYSTSTLAVSTYTLTAAYAGDSKFSASTSSAQTLTVNPVATTTTLAASATTATSGANITFTATVTPASGSLVPTGTVTFKEGTTTLGTGTLDATGKATYSTSSLATGSHSITAAYSGDTDNSSSTSTALAITVNAPPPADFTLSLTPTSGTVSAGTAATVTVTVTPVNGFNAATTFACSGLPAHATCGFNPASVTPSGTTPATTTLTINSDVATAAIAGSGAVFAFLLLPFFGRRGKRRNLLAISIPMLLLAAIAFGLSACGKGTGSGSGSGGGSNTNTPAGTYTVTVTATSGTLSHTATYTYTVN